MPSSSTQNRKSHLEALKAARAGQKRDYKASNSSRSPRRSSLYTDTTLGLTGITG
ncbi:hypothetical protein Pst134EB_026058 [Puccinia striiformis f. sp. tritici]|nr:hypothetical protein Pst134EB_026058 [Puccinia striiformis f. sp. tritici]